MGTDSIGGVKHMEIAGHTNRVTSTGFGQGSGDLNFTKNFAKQAKLAKRTHHEKEEKEEFRQKFLDANEQLVQIKQSMTEWAKDFENKIALQEARHWLLESKIKDPELLKQEEDLRQYEKENNLVYIKKASEIVLFNKFIKSPGVEHVYFDDDIHKYLHGLQIETHGVFRLGTSLKFGKFIKLDVTMFKNKVIVPLLLSAIKSLKAHKMIRGEIRLRTNTVAGFREKFGSAIGFTHSAPEDLVAAFYILPELDGVWLETHKKSLCSWCHSSDC